MSQGVLDLAQAGDETAFRDLTEPYRRELQLHCYRMLGSFTDAEDVLQETMLAAWRGLAAYQGRSSLRAWLYRIATNRCLNVLRDAGRRPRQVPLPPFDPPEPTRSGEVSWLQPYPDALLDPAARSQARELVELAFVAALQRLPRRQAATLLLRDVLGFSTAEVAEMLDTTGIAVKAALQRARATLREHRPDAQPPDSTAEPTVVRRFAEAFTTDDIEGVVALLTDDAWLTMPPAAHEYQGPAAIAGFLRASAAWRAGRRLRLVPTRANSQPAYGCYFAATANHPAEPAGLIVLTLAGERINTITRFLDTDLYTRFDRFGLPTTVT